ncbi:MAG: 2-succinyl-5-enolpyruvyl-6-hydroxy-3-cyclohexene-1-carboxylic-acid synthase [Bacteroidales bacterium]
MYADHTNVLELVALTKAYGIKHIVLSPGSRNAPLSQSFAVDDSFTCHSVVDERSAGFIALGMAMKLGQAVALCCTSGSALLNYGAAIAEAYYQGIPLLVISADRPRAWIGQQDGQTLNQPYLFDSITRRSIDIGEFRSKEERWFGNRLINEALIALSSGEIGPVHINIQISEPIYSFNTLELPEARVIKYHRCNAKVIDPSPLIDQVNKSKKRWIIIGQLKANREIIEAVRRLSQEHDYLVIAEHTSNFPSEIAVTNMDALLFAINKEEKQMLAPDLVITIGGHFISKRVREYISSNPPKAHWSLSYDGGIIDQFTILSDIIPISIETLMEDILLHSTKKNNSEYSSYWRTISETLTSRSSKILDSTKYSDLSIMRDFLRLLPEGSTLHLANSSTIRNAQLFSLPKGCTVCANRGISGIDGTISTAVGYASLCSELNYLIVGDLSFFYDMNGLWNDIVPSTLRIILVNNSGGGIFRLLTKEGETSALEPYIAARHNSSAKGWAQSRGITYLQANCESDYTELLPKLFDTSQGALILEVFTEPNINVESFKSYFKHIKSR